MTDNGQLIAGLVLGEYVSFSQAALNLSADVTVHSKYYQLWSKVMHFTSILSRDSFKYF